MRHRHARTYGRIRFAAGSAGSSTLARSCPSLRISTALLIPLAALSWSLAFSSPAMAQQSFPAEQVVCYPYATPTFTAVSGQSLRATVHSVRYFGAPDPARCEVENPRPNNCQITEALIRWGDGTSSRADSVVQPPLGDTTGRPLEITATHTYRSGGSFRGATDLTYRCTSEEGVPYTARLVGQPGGVHGFVVQVDGGSTSCPSLAASAAVAPRDFRDPGSADVRISQASCSNTLVGSYEKDIFRRLAKLYYQGYVVDKAIDDFISKWTGETWVTENIVGQGAPGTLRGVFKEFVIGKFYGKLVLDKVLIDRLPKKVSPYAWMADAPKYASYLDYMKYAVLTRLANDPPDPNFTALARPPKLRSMRGVPRQIGKRDRREAGLYIAFLTTVERADGAQQAGAATARSAQLAHASKIAKQLVRLLGAKQKALKAAARVIKRIPSGRLPRGVVRRAKRRLDSPSSKMFERRALKQLGFTDDEIAAVAQDRPAAPVKRFTRPFDKVLGLSAEAKVIRDERAVLATFAKRHALGR